MTERNATDPPLWGKLLIILHVAFGIVTAILLAILLATTLTGL